MIVSCFVSLFISLTKIVLAVSKQIVMSSCVSFQMPMGGWMKWNSKSKLVRGLEAMMCTGLLDGKSALEIQTEHPTYQIFNLTNFPNNVSHLQSKLGLESAATVTFSSPQVVPSHSPPPSFVQAYPCLESQAMTVFIRVVISSLSCHTSWMNGLMVSTVFFPFRLHSWLGLP